MIPVVFITFNYAPYNVTGSFRITKFIKYLPAEGIIPIVITANQGNHNLNPDLNLDIPPIAKIFRLKSIFPDSQIRKQSFNKIYYRKNQFLQILIRIMKDIFLSPDIQITWVIRHFLRIRRIIKESNAKIVFITGAPFSLFVLGSLLKRTLRISLIYDYRDSWILEQSQQEETFFRTRWNSILEKMSISNVDIVTATTSEILSKLKQKYKLKRSLVIPSGYDSDDFKDIAVNKGKNSDYFTFFYGGRLNLEDSTYNPIMLLECLKEVSKKQKIKWIICSSVNKELQKLFVDNYPFVDYRGFVTRSEVKQISQKVDAFIHFYYPCKLFETISMKIFEYTQYRKPIISINTQNAEVSGLLEKTHLGYYCENDNKEEIISLFEKVINLDTESFQEQIKNAELQKFSLSSTTKLLSDLIKLESRT